MSKDQLLSLLIPVHNEAGSVEPLARELQAQLPATGLAWEILWIDDGSTDGTAAALESLLASWLKGALPSAAIHLRVLRLARRSGQSAALWTGLSAARGQIIVTLDGDGQNDPADIPRLIEVLDRADMVVGQRVRRQDGLGKRVFARLANGLRNWLTGSQIPDSGCGLKAFRREVVASFLPFEGFHRFLPTMAEIAGYRVLSLPVNHRPRRQGRSKYGLVDRLIGPLLDCLMLCWLKKRRLGEPRWEEIGGRSTRPGPEPLAPKAATGRHVCLTTDSTHRVAAPSR
jgi:dolichol-phosphate mannosyltransferase